MANWIKENTLEDILIISDPDTQNIIEGLSNRLTIGGAFMGEEDQKDVLKLINSLTCEEYFNNLNYYFTTYNVKEIVIVITDRTIYWEKYGIRAFKPILLTESVLDIENCYLTPIYLNKSANIKIYSYKISNETSN
jgi:hypothetical protein